jgi:hypothetical protein
MAKGKNNGWAIASLITAILALLPLFGLLLAVTALITGYIGQKRAKQRWMAIVGMVVGAILIILHIIGLITGALNGVLRIVGL